MNTKYRIKNDENYLELSILGYESGKYHPHDLNWLLLNGKIHKRALIIEGYDATICMGELIELGITVGKALENSQGFIFATMEPNFSVEVTDDLKELIIRFYPENSICREDLFIDEDNEFFTFRKPFMITDLKKLHKWCIAAICNIPRDQ